MIKIEKNIPMPMIGKRGRQTIYPFNLMKNVGDSFFVPDKTPAQLSSVAYNWCKKYNPDWKFVAKKENDGARIWRCL